MLIPNPKLSEPDFLKICQFILDDCGIKLTSEKKTMVESRLQPRLRHLNMSSFSEYVSTVFKSPDPNGEIIHMIDCLTTNKTDFFRESAHFQYLSAYALPEFHSERSGRSFRIWSAGCSSGEEAYSLALVLNEFTLKNPGFTFEIWATDLSTRMLDIARTGIYAESRANDIPMDLKKKYLLKSIDTTQKKVRFIPEIRSKIKFDRINLVNEDFKSFGIFDAIFCRNVIIYFNKDNQNRVITKLYRQLRNECFLFIGHSEVILDQEMSLIQVRPSLYRKTTMI
ncbi:MAG: protein-glutamate O-methyltransferase CheR [Bacteroidetes bacterium]|nr:protein-glutamate O-methyltransferase CheR [Bacteroidota bacterium]